MIISKFKTFLRKVCSKGEKPLEKRKIFFAGMSFVLLPAGEGARVYSENLCHFLLGHPLELAKIDYLFTKGSTFAFKGNVAEKFNYPGEEV